MGEFIPGTEGGGGCHRGLKRGGNGHQKKGDQKKRGGGSVVQEKKCSTRGSGVRGWGGHCWELVACVVVWEEVGRGDRGLEGRGRVVEEKEDINKEYFR